MIGSLCKSRLLVNTVCISSITRRSVIYRESSSEYGDTGKNASTDTDTVSRHRSGNEVVGRCSASGRVRRSSLNNDLNEPSQSSEARSADEVPYAVKQMRERMRKKYGLEENGKGRENLVKLKGDTFLENDSFNVTVNVKHTGSRNKYGSRTRIDDPITGTNSTASPVKQPDYKDLFQKFSFLKKDKVTDKVMDMTFGAVRLDSMNKPFLHGDRDRIDLHKGSLESEDDFTVDHLSRHFEQDHTPPESMASDSWQQSDPYNETLDVENYDDMDNPYLNFGGRSFIEQEPKTPEQTDNAGDELEAQFGECRTLKTSDTLHCTQLHSAHIPSEQSRSTQVNNDSYIDEQYFGAIGLSSKEEEEKNTKSAGDGFIEKQYFEYNGVSSDKQELGMTELSSTENVLSQHVSSTEYVCSRLPEMSGGEVQLSKPQITGNASEQRNQKCHVSSDQPTSSNKQTDKPSKHSTTSLPLDFMSGNLFDSQYFSEGMLDPEKPHSSGSQSDNSINDMKPKIVQSPTTKRTVNDTFTKVDHFGTIAKQEQKKQNQPVPDLKNPQTAFDLAMKIRLEKKGKLRADEEEAKVTTPSRPKWTGKVDSKGFRILEDQVLNLEYLTEDVIVKILKDSIIYEDDDIIAIDKPYGLPSHGGPGVHHSMARYTQPLTNRLLSHNIDKLHLVHRLDKETTGVFLLAKNEKVAWRLHQMFKKREVVKKYWVITKGVPNPTEGVIDIPMAEAEVEGKYRMALRPNYSSETKLLMKSAHKVDKFEAVTNYCVLDSHQSTALVECQPESGVKHQIRCHLAFGLNTPILGDHKYSHYSKIAPQKLYPDILQRLGVRQAKVRHVPMHLHAVSLILPEFNNGRNIFISARLPKHFVQNMKWLKLKLPKGN